MLVQVAVMACAAVALWYALKGLVRMWRTRLQVTVGIVGCLVVAAAALGLALWLEVTGAEAVGDAVGDGLGWLADRLGVDTWWEQGREWARRRWLEAVEWIRDTVGLG